MNNHKKVPVTNLVSEEFNKKEILSFLKKIRFPTEVYTNGEIFLSDNQCWEWTASSNEKGYGRKYWRNHTKYAHRLSYRLFCGEIPPNMQVHHICKNPKCVNPNHLLLVTSAQHHKIHNLFGNSKLVWHKFYSIQMVKQNFYQEPKKTLINSPTF